MNQTKYLNELDRRIEELEIASTIAKDRLSSLENPCSIMNHEFALDPLTESKKALEECRNILRKIKKMHNDLEKSNAKVIARMEEFAAYFDMPKTFHIRRELRGGKKFSEDVKTLSMRRKNELDTNQREDPGKT